MNIRAETEAVPVIRMDSGKIRALGWANRLSSRQALYASMEAMYKEGCVDEGL